MTKEVRCPGCGALVTDDFIGDALEEALSLAELDYAQNLTKIINDGIKTEKKLEKQISTLSAKVQELQTELEELGKHHAIHHENEYELQTELEKWKKQTKAHEEFIGEKLREINCVKDHPEIKPLNCCWMADSMELKIRRKDVESRPK